MIDDGRLYIGDADGVLRAIDRESGDLIWRYTAGAAIASGAAVDDLRVYVHSRDGVVQAVSKTDGKLLWRFRTGGEAQWDYWDYYLSTPAVDDRQVYFGSGDHHIYALDKRTGVLRWKVEAGEIVHGEPAVSGEKIIIGGFDGRLYAIDKGAGAVLWTFKTVGNEYFRNGAIPGSASVADGIVYVGSRDFNVYAILEETGTGAWNVRTPSWVVARPLVLDDTVYIANSDGARVLAYGARYGDEKWEVKRSFNIFAAPVALGNHTIAVAGLDGRIAVLARETGETLATYDTGASAANRGRFFDQDGKLKTDEIKSLEDLMALYDRFLGDMGGIAGGLAVDGSTLYYAAGNGEVAALRVTGLEGDTPD